MLYRQTGLNKIGLRNLPKTLKIWHSKNMSEDRNRIQERREARAQFFEGFFPEWKKTFCVEMSKQNPAFIGKENAIIWRKDTNGTEYSPHCIADLYFHRYRPKAIKRLMKEHEKYQGKNPERVLDRHKIVALTQQLVLEHWPVTYSCEKMFSQESKPTLPVRVLNVSFAYNFAIEFLASWNDVSFKKQEKPFDAGLLFECFNHTDFAKEHYKYLMLDLTDHFPVPLIAQLWFVAEQWGLNSLSSFIKK